MSKKIKEKKAIEAVIKLAALVYDLSIVFTKIAARLAEIVEAAKEEKDE